jgi:uncharacterized protein (DUF2235 family)
MEDKIMKNIVVCCDGTGNEYGEHNTNVVDLYSVAIKSTKQITFYDPGIGTGGWEYEEESSSLRAKHDQATGEGLQKNVEDAYRFLMRCYEEGDRLYLFGFSRGAFTVRALAGMLYKVGLLRIDNENLLEYASKLYCSKDNKYSDAVVSGFRSTFGRPCPAHFIGVWDTVESLVLNAGRRFYNYQLSPETQFGYHALAIDEKRKDFPPCLWDETHKVPGQTVEQVWFPGVHSDVGGWYDERGLSNTALLWMIGKAQACGMEVDMSKAAAYGSNPHDRIHESYEGFWIFRGSAVRTIPSGALIHSSAIERLERAANRYKPQNLPANCTIVT